MRVYNLLLELKSFPAAGVTQSQLDRAKESTTVVPGEMMEAWMDGSYDEDPNCLVDELEITLKMNRI